MQTQSLGFNVMAEEPGVWNDTATLEVSAVSHHVGREPGQTGISLPLGTYLWVSMTPDLQRPLSPE